MFTHEMYINAVVEAAKKMVANDPKKLAQLERVKIVYGLGEPGLRGVTWYNKWQPHNAGKGDEPQTIDLIEVCAFGQESWVQVAGTTIHELGHVIAGIGTGHGPEWKNACEELGLRNPKATSHKYLMSGFDPLIRHTIAALPKPEDGSPVAVANHLGITPRLKVCTAGVGTRGGKSRGAGSGSRMIKCSCGSCGYTVRTSATWLAIGLPICPVEGHGNMVAN